MSIASENPDYLIGYGQGDPLRPFFITPKMANRHGLIAGATGTGKTFTLRKMAELFSDQGVPSILVDVKGDLSGMAKPGKFEGAIAERLGAAGYEPRSMTGYPVRFWDIFGEKGIPLRVTISEMGPLLLSRLFQLNETQEGVLNVAFRVADDRKLFLFDLKDLRAVLRYCADHAAELKTQYGNVSSASVGAIQRRLLAVENQGAGQLFGEPAAEIADFVKTEGGRGVVNIVNAERLMRAPEMFSAFFLWLLAELYQEMPEVGDLDKPKFALFFDESHLIFDNASPALVRQAEQVARLIRSKGVGLYFCSQSPLDIPDAVLGQLGNRVQHALRAFTPRDQKAARAAAQTFRANPGFKTEEEITALGVGEALISFLNEKGEPGMVEKALIIPPMSQSHPLSDEERAAVFRADAYWGKYKDPVDSVSAFEMLASRAKELAEAESKAMGSKAKGSPGLIDGITDAVVGNRKNAKGGLAYDLSLNVSRNIKNRLFSQMSRAITRSIMGVFDKKR